MRGEEKFGKTMSAEDSTKSQKSSSSPAEVGEAESEKR